MTEVGREEGGDQLGFGVLIIIFMHVKKSRSGNRSCIEMWHNLCFTFKKTLNIYLIGTVSSPITITINNTLNAKPHISAVD